VNHLSETEKGREVWQDGRIDGRTGGLEEDGRLGRMGSMRRMGGWADGRMGGCEDGDVFSQSS